MHHSNEHDYLTMRAAFSRSMERCAASPVVAAIHAEMACRYESRANQIVDDTLRASAVFQAA